MSVACFCKYFRVILDLFLSLHSLLKLFIHLFICVYIVWAISCPFPLPPPSPPTPLALRQNLFCPLLQFCWRDNKKDMEFLLAWDKDSYTEIPSIASMSMCITTWINSSLPDLFTTSWPPSYSGLCQFMITLLGPLQWAHQTLSSFRFPSLSLFFLYAFSP
jgi:hypothetical protein